MLPDNGEEQWMIPQHFFCVCSLCASVCVWSGLCLLPDLHSVIVLLVPGLNNTTEEGYCIFSLISFWLFLCTSAHEFCVCVFVASGNRCCIVSVMEKDQQSSKVYCKHNMNGCIDGRMLDRNKIYKAIVISQIYPQNPIKLIFSTFMW